MPPISSMQRTQMAGDATMNMSEAGRKALQEREGCRLQAYKDTMSVWTICTGSTRDLNGNPVKQGLSYTQAQCDQLFASDLAEFERAVENAVRVPVHQAEFDALVSFAYNVGAGGMSGSTAVKRLNEGDFQGCADGLLMWLKPPEITQRRYGEHVGFCEARYIARSTAPAPKYTAKSGAPLPPPVAPRPTLRRGSTGLDVESMQRLVLYKLRLVMKACSVDGDFGGKTEEALKACQAAFALTPDGICGPVTWDKLLESSGGAITVAGEEP